MELTPCTGCDSKRGAAARRPLASNCPDGGPARKVPGGITTYPMSSTGGGGGGSGGGSFFGGAIWLAAFPAGFELLAGFFAAAGFLAAGLAADDLPAAASAAHAGDAHSAAHAAARDRAR